MKNFLWLLILSIFIVSCGNEIRPLTGAPAPESSNGDDIDPPLEPSPTPPVVDHNLIDPKLWICSNLDFDGMIAPIDLSDIEINLFALALNISASFEGRQGWQNITNNFDGMGLSLGLLNQTLGTGSLQPLLVKMIEKFPLVMKDQYSAENYRSIKSMALQWKVDTGFVVQQKQQLFAPNHSVINALDNGEVFEVQGAAEVKSVNWAKNTIYTTPAGKTFKADWKASLQAMAGVSEYRDLQFEAARVLHRKAAGYVSTFGLTEVRSYLFMFDIVVQNGGFYQQNFTDYRNFIAANPRATERQKLEAILASRLVQVRSQYREDVRARKQGLIDGKGRVHQTNRNFEQEYCYVSTDAI